MNHVNPIYNYTTEAVGDTTKFSYKKSQLSYKIGCLLCFAFGLISAIITPALEPATVQATIAIWLLITLFFSFGLVFILNKAKSKAGEFFVSKDSITVDGNRYSFEHIKYFSIKDPQGGYSETSSYTTTTVYRTNTVAGNVHAIGNAVQGVNNEINGHIKKMVRQTRFKVVARFATKDIIIARGLSENDAEALFDKLTEVSGYSKTT